MEIRSARHLKSKFVRAVWIAACGPFSYIEWTENLLTTESIDSCTVLANKEHIGEPRLVS